MSALGAIVSLIASGAYAVGQRIVINTRIASHKMPQRTRTNDEIYMDLIQTFRENWDKDGASLFPEKMIPFLSIDGSAREMWIDCAVRSIMFDRKLGTVSLRRSMTGWQYGATPHIDNGELVGQYGPLYYEYDFVKEVYPEDWDVYVERDKAEYEKQLAIDKRNSIINYTLIVIASLLIFCGLIIIFVTRPNADKIQIVNIIYMISMVVIGIAAVLMYRSQH